MKTFIIEFAWQVEEIVRNKINYKNDIIVSLDPESSYLLKTNKILYHEPYEFCNHKELWSKYKDLTNQTIEIVKLLDEALWKIDERFRNNKWRLFNDYHYLIKISFDQLFYYSYLIQEVISKFKPSEIIISDSKEIVIDKLFLIDSKISILKYLVQSEAITSHGVKISLMSLDHKKKSKIKYYKKFKGIFRNVLKNTFYKIIFLINLYTTKPKYLSIDCLEVLKYKELYPKESKLFLSFHHQNTNKKKFIKNWNLFESFMNYLRKETNFYELIKCKNISFELIFNEILFKLTKELDFLLYELKNTKKIIEKVKPKCVIFNSMAPHSPSTIVFRKNCYDSKIPFATWSHGGYGLTHSLAGYDVTDFRFCKNQISYGSFLKDLINNNECILREFKFNQEQNIFPVGSPKFDFDNRKKISNKNFKKNEKPTVLFLTGLLSIRNQFFFGRNREKCETSIWEFQYEVLSILKKYQNKYNIIFKDYPNGNANLWKVILKNIGAEKILYISNEHKVNDLLRMSDLNIVPWASTPFFEALYFNADIFVIEEDLCEKFFEGVIKNEIFHFKKSEKFLFALEKYLEEGNFYKNEKKNSKNYFIQHNSINKRNILLNETLSKLIQ